MHSNLFEAQEMARGRMNDAMLEAERHRQIRAAKGPRQAREWRLPVALLLNSLLAVIIQPQSRRLPQGGREECL